MKTRLLNCDILRIIAFSFVVGVHSLSYAEFYVTPMTGTTMLFLNFLRCLFITCVPLFLVLSGYLMIEKTLSKNYLKKLSRIIVTYILCSIACMVGLHFTENGVFSIKHLISGILSFTAAPYAWYVNMYLGLYLLIPFLNILWNNLKNKQEKLYLIIVLSILTVLPTLFNIFRFDSLNWWIHPANSRDYQQLIPNFWQEILYPILYYFIGCYLKQFPLKMSTKKNTLYLMISILLFGLFNYYRDYGFTFYGSIFSNYFSFECLIVTVLFANLVLCNLHFKISNEKVIKFISKVSYLTFGAYLLSKIFDSWFYPFLLDHTSTMKERLPFFIPIIILIMICSLLLSFIIDLVQQLIFKVCKQKK